MPPKIEPAKGAQDRYLLQPVSLSAPLLLGPLRYAAALEHTATAGREDGTPPGRAAVRRTGHKRLRRVIFTNRAAAFVVADSYISQESTMHDFANCSLIPQHLFSLRLNILLSFSNAAFSCLMTLACELALAEHIL